MNSIINKPLTQKGEMMHDTLKFLLKARRLSYIERCSNTPHIRPYNVAEHSYYLSLYAMIFADLENKRIIHDCNINQIELEDRMLFDTELVIKKALIHDLEEIITGDILYPLKNETSAKGALAEVINSCVCGELFEELPEQLKQMYISLWQDAKDDTKEGQLVAAMDKFEILVYALTESSLGNRALEEIFNTAKHILRMNFTQIITLQNILNNLTFNLVKLKIERKGGGLL